MFSGGWACALEGGVVSCFGSGGTNEMVLGGFVVLRRSWGRGRMSLQVLFRVFGGN